jgi:hypothetical protein
MPAMQKYGVSTYSVRRALFLPSNAAPDFSRSPHESDDSIHEFAEAIIFDSNASLLGVTAGLQKVSAQLEVSNSARHVTLKNR